MHCAAHFANREQSPERGCPYAIVDLVASTALAIAAPAAAFADHHGGGHAAHKGHDAIAAAVAAPTRTPANTARDKYRNPAETLAFFGVKPGDTVVELWPGGGWYTEILAPLAKSGGGTLYAAAPWERGLNRIKEWQGANADPMAASSRRISER